MVAIVVSYRKTLVGTGWPWAVSLHLCLTTCSSHLVEGPFLVPYSQCSVCTCICWLHLCIGTLLLIINKVIRYMMMSLGHYASSGMGCYVHGGYRKTLVGKTLDGPLLSTIVQIGLQRTLLTLRTGSISGTIGSVQSVHAFAG